VARVFSPYNLNGQGSNFLENSCKMAIHFILINSYCDNYCDYLADLLVLTSINFIFRYICVTLHLQDAMEYAECEAVVKDFPPFREAMKRRGIEDMDLVMVDAW
jgi:hypothetical protein